eukprot:CFRG7092T1
MDIPFSNSPLPFYRSVASKVQQRPAVQTSRKQKKATAGSIGDRKNSTKRHISEHIESPSAVVSTTRKRQRKTTTKNSSTTPRVSTSTPTSTSTIAGASNKVKGKAKASAVSPVSQAVPVATRVRKLSRRTTKDIIPLDRLVSHSPPPPLVRLTGRQQQLELSKNRMNTPKDNHFTVASTSVPTSSSATQTTTSTSTSGGGKIWSGSANSSSDAAADVRKRTSEENVANTFTSMMGVTHCTYDNEEENEIDTCASMMDIKHSTDDDDDENENDYIDYEDESENEHESEDKDEDAEDSSDPLAILSSLSDTDPTLANILRHAQENGMELPTSLGDLFMSGMRMSDFRGGAGVRSGGRFQPLLEAMADFEDETRQIVAVTDLCEQLSVATEETLSGFPTQAMIANLMRLMNAEHNPDLMLVAIRTITHLLEAKPSSTLAVVRAGVVPALCAKLLSIEYIDLAEQSLTALEKLSVEHGIDVLRAGGLMACLSYIDFFATSVQRVAVNVCANVCRSVPHDYQSLIVDASPLLTQLLDNQDAKIVEGVCLCFARLVDTFRHSETDLTALAKCGFYHKLLHNITATPRLINAATFTMVLTTFSTLLKGAPVLTAKLIEYDIPSVLRTLLSASTTNDDHGSTTMCTPESTPNHRNLRLYAGLDAEQLYEIFFMTAEMLPSLPREGVFSPIPTPTPTLTYEHAAHGSTSAANTIQRMINRTFLTRRLGNVNGRVENTNAESANTNANTNTSTSESVGSSLGASGDMCVSARTSGRLDTPKYTSQSISTTDVKVDPRQKILLDNPSFLPDLAAIFIPVVVAIQEYSFGVRVRNQSAHVLNKILYFSNAPNLKEALRHISVSSFLAGQLVRKDPPEVQSGIQMAFTLMDKLPDVFSFHFEREGVVFEICRLYRTYKRQSTARQNKKITVESSAEERKGKEKLPNAKVPTEHSGSKGKLTAKLKKRFSRTNSKDNTNLDWKVNSKDSISGSKKTKEATDVDVGESPTGNIESNNSVSLSSTGAHEGWSIAQAHLAEMALLFLTKYCPNNLMDAEHGTSQSELLTKLQPAFQYLRAGRDEQDALDVIAQSFVNNKSGITAFEMRHGNVVPQLVAYLIGGDDRERREKLFVKAFMKSNLFPKDDDSSRLAKLDDRMCVPAVVLLKHMHSLLAKEEIFTVALHEVVDSSTAHRYAQHTYSTHRATHTQTSGNAMANLHTLVRTLRITVVRDYTNDDKKLVIEKMKEASREPISKAGLSEKCKRAVEIPASTDNTGERENGLLSHVTDFSPVLHVEPLSTVDKLEQYLMTNVKRSRAANLANASGDTSVNAMSDHESEDSGGIAVIGSDSDKHYPDDEEDYQDIDSDESEDMEETEYGDSDDDDLPGAISVVFDVELGKETEEVDALLSPRTTTTTAEEEKYATIADRKKDTSTTKVHVHSCDTGKNNDPGATRKSSTTTPKRSSYRKSLPPATSSTPTRITTPHRKSLPTSTNASTPTTTSAVKEEMLAMDFYLDGHLIPRDMPLFFAIQTFAASYEHEPQPHAYTNTGVSENSLPVNPRAQSSNNINVTRTKSIPSNYLWRKTYCLTYKVRVLSSTSAASSRNKASESILPPPPTHGICIEGGNQYANPESLLQVLEKYTAEDNNVKKSTSPTLENNIAYTNGSTTLDADALVYSHLTLMGVLWREYVRAHGSSILTSVDFINPKISSKILLQLSDPLSVASRCMPQWVGVLMTRFNFLFSYECRKQYMTAMYIGPPRSTQKMLANSSKTAGSLQARLGNLRLTTNLRIKARVQRSRLLDSCVKMLRSLSKNNAVIGVEFINETGTGLGPTLEFFCLSSREFQRRDLCMWRDTNDKPATQNGKELVQSIYGLFPSPIPVREVKQTTVLTASATTNRNATSTSGESQLTSLFEVTGMLLARALIDNRLIDLPLNPVVYAWLTVKDLDVTECVDEHACKSSRVSEASLLSLASLHNLSLIDPDLERTLASLQRAVENADDQTHVLIEGVAVEDLCLDFTLPGFPHIELINDGANVSVTSKNVADYISLVLKYTIVDGVREQMMALRRGFAQVLSLESVSMFTQSEFDTLLCGATEKWDLDMLHRVVKPDHGYTHTSRPIQWLFNVISKFDLPKQRQFLQFITGAPQLPVGGLAALSPPLTVVRVTSPLESADGFLPSVMTCVNYFKLPEYSSETILAERLDLAVREGTGSFHLS